jgi:Flp pilus assembly protein TadG
MTLPDSSATLLEPAAGPLRGIGTAEHRESGSERPRARWRRNRLPKRSGVSTLWLILTLPVALCLLGVVVETGNLWLARVELTNALEAATLAGVDQWGDAGGNTMADRNTARATAVTFALTNTVNDWPVGVGANGGGAAPNDNASYSGNVIVLGAYHPGTRQFDGTLDPQTAGYDFAVNARATVPVNSIIGSFCGVTFSPLNVTTQVTARYDAGQPKLVRVDSFVP